MLVVVVYRLHIHSLLGCCMSLGGVFALFQVTGCWISPVGSTIHILSIQGGHLLWWCRLLLNYSGHMCIVHQVHIWYLTDIFHWIRHCMLIDCREDTNFNQYRILMQQPGWYLPHSLCWSCVCCAIDIYIDSSVMVSILNNSCDDVWKNVSPGYGISSHSLVGIPIMRLYDASSAFTNFFASPPSGGLIPYFPWFVFLNDSSPSLSFVFV